MSNRTLNPAVAEEARWLDGIRSEQDMADLAARRGLPLYIDREPQVRAAPPPRPTVEVKRTLVLCSELRLRDCERQLADARAELRRRVVDLQAAIESETAA